MRVAAGKAVWLAALVCFLCPSAANGQLNTFTGIEPVAYLVERIGGGHVTVGVLVGSGQNPHTYEPSPRLLAEVSAVTLYFQVGLPFEERLLGKIRSAHPDLRVVNLRDGIAMRPMEAGREGHEDEGGAFDPHIWLSPVNARIMAGHIARALDSADPAHAQAYKANLDALSAELDALHRRITEKLAPFRGRAFYAYHPGFGYFADAYGLRQVAVEVEGKEPTAKQLAQLVSKAREDGIRTIFVQRQFSAKSAESLAREIGGHVVMVDPLARDYVRNLEAIAAQLARSFG